MAQGQARSSSPSHTCIQTDRLKLLALASVKLQLAKNIRTDCVQKPCTGVNCLKDFAGFKKKTLVEKINFGGKMV